MEYELEISILILGSTIYAFLVSLFEQGRNHQPILFARMLHWERLEENFARIFLTGLGAVVGAYLAAALNSFLDTENTNRALLISFCGGLIGAIVARWFIFEKMVAPQFRAMYEKKILSSLQPPQEP